VIDASGVAVREVLFQEQKELLAIVEALIK